MKKIFLIFALLLLFFGTSEAKSLKKNFHKKAVAPKAKAYSTSLFEELFEVNLTQGECEKLINSSNKPECFRRDSFFSDPYYHQTKITIFRGKVFAEQFFRDAEKPTNRLFLAVKNGSYKVKDRSGNLVSLTTQNGFVSNLKITRNKKSSEKTAQIKCKITEAIYGFHQTYYGSGINVEADLFADEKNFKGLQEFFIFSEKEKPQIVMAMSNLPNQTPTALENITICKMPNAKHYSVKYFDNEICDPQGDEDEFLECQKYKECSEHLIVKNCEALVLN